MTARGPSSRPTGRASSSSSARATPISRPRSRYLPNVELYGVEPDDYGPGDRAHGRPAVGPDHLRGLPAGDPAATADPGHRAAALQRARRRDRHAHEPGHRLARPRRAVLRYVDLSTTHIAEAVAADDCRRGRGRSSRARGARRCSTPGHATAIRTAVLAFEPRRSDLPLQVAFPILLANLTGELLGGSTAPTEAVQPGTPGRARHPGRRERPDRHRAPTAR